MTELRAIVRSDARQRPELTAINAETANVSSYDSPDLKLICRADLLTNEDTPTALMLARLYQKHGDSFVKSLRGTFAIIIYDSKQRTLKAWTDHFGAERLVVAEAPGFVAISTDLRLLLPLFEQTPEIDPMAVQEYLQYSFIPAPRTIYNGISRLKPGHQLTSQGTVSQRPYWDMSYREGKHLSQAAWAEKTASAIGSAVDVNLAGVNPSQLGCFLSGGTDSSSVAGVMSKLGGRRARTFSIGFDDPRYNEIDYARIAARHNASDHHEYFVTPDDILSLINKAIPAYDEPFGNSSIIPTYYCARLAAEHGVTHLLAGDGGDELFGGNSRYADDRLFQRYGAIPAWMRHLLVEPVVSAVAGSSKAARYIRRSSIPVPDRYHSYSLVSTMPHGELFADDFLATLAGHNPLIPARNHFESAPAKDDLNRWLYMDLKMIIGDNDLRKVSVMSRLAGVTARYPLLDPALAEFTGTIPVDLKVRGPQLRFLFKKAMADILPSEIITKRKHGFGLPYSVWLREHTALQEFTLDVLGSLRCRQRGYFRENIVDWLWTQYKSVHQGYYGELLWVFLMLELWHLNQYDAKSASQLTLCSVH